RLNVYAIRLPALRERGDDIDLLTDYYLTRFGQEFGRPAPVVPPETRAGLRAYRWPGNVRELQSVLKQGVLRMAGSVLLPDFLTALRPAAAGMTGPEPATAPAPRPALDWNQFITERLEAGSRELY